MSNTFSKKPIALALGAAFAMNGLATQAGTVFQASDLTSGYMQLAEGKCGEGKCGEGKCGAEMFDKMDKDKDGKLTKDEFMSMHKAAEAKTTEGKCGEGKCGEGKCGTKK